MSKPDLTPERLAELRAIAEAATQGEWNTTHNGIDSGEHGVDCSGSGRYGDIVPCTEETLERDAIHIAAFDPPTVLALLDEVGRLRVRVTAHDHHREENDDG